MVQLSVDILLKQYISDTSQVCKSNNVITNPEAAEIVCSKCGMVISDKIQETRQDSRTFLNNEGRMRRAMPTSLACYLDGLSTVIARRDKDANGYEIKPSMLSTMHRLRTWDFRTQVGSGSHRNLRYAFRELDTLKDKLGLPDAIIEKTAYLYRRSSVS